MRTLVLISACFALAIAACSGTSEDQPEGQAGTGGSAGTGGAAGSTAGNAGSTAGNAGSECKAPVFSTNCAEVPGFQRDFAASCEGNVAKASWHYHYMCNGVEQIANYTCTSDCGEAPCIDSHVGWPQSGSQFVAEVCGSGAGGAAGSAGSAGTGGTAGNAGSGGCEIPSFSTDCSLVTEFQCGFSATCDGKTAKVSWHHHVMCNGQEQIVPFTCSYECATACNSDYHDWPQNGAKLVAGICDTGAGGSAGDGGNCTPEHGGCTSTTECCNLWDGTGGAAGGQQTGTVCEPTAKTCEHCSNQGENCSGPYAKCCPGLGCNDAGACEWLPD